MKPRKKLYIFLALGILFCACDNSSTSSEGKGHNKQVITNADTATKNKPSVHPVETKADAGKPEDNSEPVQEYEYIKQAVTSLMRPEANTFFVKDAKAVFIFPDSMEISKMKAEYGAESFYAIANDNSYYDDMALEFLKRKKVSNLSTGARFVGFPLNSGDSMYVDTDQQESKWILLLFDGKDKVYFANSIDIEEAWQEVERK